MTEKITSKTIELIALCAELKVLPRVARAKLRAAVTDNKSFPNLAQNHKPGSAWKWTAGTKALQEARKALSGEAK